MKIAVLTILVILAIGGLYVVVPVIADAYNRFRGVKSPVCPETGENVALEVDAGRAALTAAVGDPELHVKQCSRWPERHDCDERCLEGLEREARAGDSA